MPTPTPTRIGDYLIEQLYRHGAEHLFGIPGDYILSFFDLLSRHEKVKIINTCDEQGAGFAADAYARLRGLGAVCVTYGVGGLKVANTTAEAYAEKSPVVVISGAPGLNERRNNPLLHHKIKEFDTQQRVFEAFTVASAVLDNPDTAFQEIDRVIHAALRHKRPVYLELPRDMVMAEGLPNYTHAQVSDRSDPDTLHEAVAEAVAMINNANRPVILAGVELQRFGLQTQLIDLAQKTGIPVAATILAKSVISEQLPFYLGIYEGATGLEAIRDYVESSDCLLILGAFMTDIDLGIFTAQLEPAHSIYATSEKITIKRHSFEQVLLSDFLAALKEAPLRVRHPDDLPPRPPASPFLPGSGSEKITVHRLFQRLDLFLKDNTVVIADVGDALFGANDLSTHRATEFLSPAYYASLGFAVPAAIGVHLANPNHRALVLVGDGSFQMTGMELSTIARLHLNPIVLVLNNEGYGTERLILDGTFNNIHPWQYSRLPEILGQGQGFRVRSEAELETALQAAEQNQEEYTIIEVMLDRHDQSPALGRLTARLKSQVAANKPKP